jgi:adenylate kinase family enzyme
MLPFLITGVPGSGKSTTAKLLADATHQAVHIETDYFFRFVTHALDPSKPESKSQNEIVVRAYCSAAKAYVEGGYDVIMDGIIGPWMFPLILESLGSFDYVLLGAPLALTLERMEQRAGQGSATPSMAGRMFPQFERIAEAYPDNVIDTASQSVEAVVSVIDQGRRSGRFTIIDQVG